MPGYGIIDGVALRELASAMVFEKWIQDILHVNGKGVDESYISGDVLNAQSIAIPKVQLGGGAFRTLGATVNGGQFNSEDPVVSTSDYFYVPLLYVYDHTEVLARIMNDKAGYALLEKKMQNLRYKITRGINALTFAVQFAQTLNESYDDVEADLEPTYIAQSSTLKAYDAYITANAKLDEGDAAIECDYFPREMRQAFVRPSFLAKLKTESGTNFVMNSTYGQEMLATGVLNPFQNTEASKINMRNGYSGDIDGVSIYVVSPILFQLAAGYCQSNSAALAATAFDNIDAMVCCGIGTLRGFNSTTDIEVVPAQQGQGWVLQPLIHGGCVCVSGKSVRLIVTSTFTNPVTSAATKITILPPESQQGA